METSLKKWMLRRCGWGPSDCQNCDVDGFRRASTPQSGLKVETVQDARADISRRCERDGSGTAVLRFPDEERSVQIKPASGELER